ncbi:unnamed protein product [Closterium sp. NIES-53]
MPNQRLVSGLPWVFESLPPSPALPCTPCVEGRLRATPHSSSLHPATALFQALHLGQGTCGSRVCCLHSERGGEFRSGTGSPGVASEFHVWGCLALVYNTSADKLSACAIPYVFLGFPVDSPDVKFYHPPLHRFLDSCDVRFDKSVSYYTWYPCRGLPVPPPPSFPRPHFSFSCSSNTPTPPWSYPVRCISRYPSTLLRTSPSPQSSSQSPQQPLALLRHVTVDSRGVGVGGAATGGPRTEGARLRGAGAGGTGTGGASCGGAGAGSADTGGASSADAGAGSAGTGGASSGGAGAGGVRAGVSGTGGASFEATGAGGTATVAPTAPPHRYNTRLQALCQLEREEQKRLEQKRQELRQLDQREQQQVPQDGLCALGLPSSPLVRSQSPTGYGPTFPPVFSPPQSQSPPPVLPHDWTTCCPPRARPSSPFNDLCTVLFRSSSCRAPPVSVLPPPPVSSLTISSHPIII